MKDDILLKRADYLLSRYGVHDPDCPEGAADNPGDCQCGLHDAITELTRREWHPVGAGLPPTELQSNPCNIVPLLVMVPEKYGHVPAIGLYDATLGSWRVEGSGSPVNVSHWMPMPRIP